MLGFKGLILSTTKTTTANFNTHANVDDDFYVFSRIDIDVNVT